MAVRSVAPRRTGKRSQMSVQNPPPLLRKPRTAGLFRLVARWGRERLRRRRAARVVLHQWLHGRDLVDDHVVVRHVDDPLDLRRLVPRHDDEAIVLLAYSLI